MKKTRQRIIDASLLLFNEQGERNVTTNHIAAHLGISPGNLYYHFRNKDAIIRAIFVDYTDYWQQSFAAQDAAQAPLDTFTETLDVLFNAIWRFRFFYANLPELLARDPILRRDYLQLTRLLDVRLEQSLRDLIDVGELQLPIALLPDMCRSLRLTLNGWLAFRMTSSEDAQISRQMVFEGIHQGLFLLKPWVRAEDQAGFEQLEQACRQRVEAIGAEHAQDSESAQ